jgi:hypothetical protein
MIKDNQDSEPRLKGRSRPEGYPSKCGTKTALLMGKIGFFVKSPVYKFSFICISHFFIQYIRRYVSRILYPNDRLVGGYIMAFDR